MSDNTPILNNGKSSLEEQMVKLLSTADGPKFSICSQLYRLILSADSIEMPSLFEKAINLYEDIDSDKTVQIDVSPYEDQKEILKNKYGDIVNSFIEFFVAQQETSKAFYENIWESIQNNVFFPTEASKVFAFYYVIIDRRVPYFELEQGYKMSNEAYKKLRKKYATTLKKVRYIYNAEFDQRTERASLLLNELGITMPNLEANYEIVEEYEQKLITMAEIISVAKLSEFSFESVIKHTLAKVSD